MHKYLHTLQKSVVIPGFQVGYKQVADPWGANGAMTPLY